MAAERKVPYVLVVDDEDVLREVLRRRLSMEGFEVETAEDGEEAVAILERDDFVNVVLTDVKMPGLDGIAVMRRAKKKNHDIQVIVMTAYADSESAIAAVRENAYDYLTKPFSHLDDVVAKVKRALREQKLELQNREMMRKLEEMNRGLKEVLLSRTKEVNEVQAKLRETADGLRRGLEAIDRALPVLVGGAIRDAATAMRVGLGACAERIAHALVPAPPPPSSGAGP